MHLDVVLHRLYTGTVGADHKLSSEKCDSGTFTEEQLEQMLAQKYQEWEQEQLSGAISSVVAVSEVEADVFGPVLLMDMDMEGVVVLSIVDTGA